MYFDQCWMVEMSEQLSFVDKASESSVEGRAMTFGTSRDLHFASASCDRRGYVLLESNLAIKRVIPTPGKTMLNPPSPDPIRDLDLAETACPMRRLWAESRSS